MTPPTDRTEEFVRLLGQNQRRVYHYILCLVPNRTEAEEVVQETNLVLWREFDQFATGTNFAAWACRVAFHQVLAWRKRRQRDRLEFSDGFLEAVAHEADTAAEHLEERAEALSACIGRLPAGQRDLLRWRYSDNEDVDTIAQRSGRTVEAVYRALSRIRQALHECVSRALEQRT